MYSADYNNTINSKGQINDHMLFSELASYESKKDSSFQISGNLPNIK